VEKIPDEIVQLENLPVPNNIDQAENDIKE
jgi:hypothetical protein